MQNKIFSTDSAKAIKAMQYGVINGIHYMAPHELAGVGNLCPHASPGCIALCLGEYSGQAGMAKDGELNSVRKSRRDKARRFMQARVAYMQDVALATAQEYARAKKKGFAFVARFNGATDVAIEGVKVYLDDKLATKISKLMGRNVPRGFHTSIMALFPEIPFVDYTKNPLRFRRALPVNYHLTFSRSETNEAQAIELLSKGVNVAVVFAGGLPDTWQGFPVIDGDLHDLRHLDPRGPRGYVIGLSPKGRKAKRDQSGFVVRDHAAQALALAA